MWYSFNTYVSFVFYSLYIVKVGDLMLSDYEGKQSLAYKLLVSDLNNNCVTHAYLFDENDYSFSYEMVISFVKSLLCVNKINNVNCNECSICKRIDDGDYPEFKVIVPDGLYIKKQQIIDLQLDFSRSAIEGNKRIYIIRDCDKMRPEAANAILKFLEDPEDNVVAILMTNNINNVLSTIISRCKLIKLNSDIDGKCDVDDLLVQRAFDFLLNIEKKGNLVLVDEKDILGDLLVSKDRERLIIFFDILIDIYYDVLKYLSGVKKIKYLTYIDKIKDIACYNNIGLIIDKINMLVDYKESIKFNVNINLLFDSVIVSIGGVSSGSRC